MNLLSGVRLGVGLGLIPNVGMYALNKLLVFTQPAHLAAAQGRVLADDEVPVRRAAYVRQVLEEEVGRRGSSAGATDPGMERRMNGYNFTDRVRKVLQMAREEAARLHHEYVGTEHILLGLIREGEGVAAAVLTNLNVDLDDIQQKIEETVKKGKAAAAPGPDLPVHLARQEGARARHDRGPRAQSLLRRHRAPAARPAARGEGHRRPGADRRRGHPGAVARRDPAAAGQRHAAAAAGRRRGADARRPPRPSRRRNPRRRRSITSAAISPSSPPKASSIRPSGGRRKSSGSWRSWPAARRTIRC